MPTWHDICEWLIETYPTDAEGAVMANKDSDVYKNLVRIEEPEAVSYTH